ncbi:protein NO VEIN domain-containing protein [Treponema primitia]|uniref:protein NO VEIN domain-containing protein n=1 Tax=Treponema primitia TaxID=88058 RepID=UPI000308AC02|nr:DUF3883 domain-containing protein [Treponema primitia]
MQLLKHCALFLADQHIDWRPYKLLSPSSSSSDSKLIERFYKKLDDLRQKESIYPSVDKDTKYNIRENAFYYNDDFNGFFEKNFPQVFPGLTLPITDNGIHDIKNRVFSHEFLIEKIDKLSKTGMSIQLRSDLIIQLSGIIEFKENQERFSLLINKFNKVITKDDLAFTPVLSSEENLEIPALVKIDFMDFDLYQLLILKLENKFDKNEPKNRELQRSIKSVVNLQPYDSNNVIEKIITGTNAALKNTSNAENKITYIKEMVAALYSNFKNIENRQEKVKIAVPLISKENTICNSENLYLSESYPSGRLTEIIFKDIFQAKEYLLPINLWKINDDDHNFIESFFLWLGVNRYSKIVTFDLQNNWLESDYIDFIFKNGTYRPENFDINRIKNSIVSKIDGFDKIQKLDINKIILLSLKDSSIRTLLETNDEKIDWYYNKGREPIITNFSYIRYQFINANIFTKYILEAGSDDLNKLINQDFMIDYEFLSKFGINKTEIKSILIKLGAKEFFNELSPENIYKILKEIPQKDEAKKGKATQTIYRMALEVLVARESTFPIPEDIQYFTRRAKVEEYKSRSDVYYTDNSILPKKILNTLPMLNLPKRIGEDNVKKYFGVNNVKEFKIFIEDEQSVKFNPCDSDLNKWFDTIKPYILAYRLDPPNQKKGVADNDKKREDARILKSCKIHVVTQCDFRFNNNRETLEEKEFINIKDIFYFKESSILNIDGLKKDSEFCDSFAEMICIIFKINDLKNDFRQIFRNDIEDTRHLTYQDLEKEKIEEAFQLLGISRVEIYFWKVIFELKNKKLIEPIENIEILKQNIKSIIGITIPDGYGNVDFENFNNNESYEFISLLCNELQLSVEKVLPDKGLCNWHRKKFMDSIKDNEYKFSQILWQNLNIAKKDQCSFIAKLNKYNIDFINSIEKEINECKFDLAIDYRTIIKEKINDCFAIDIDAPLQVHINIKNMYENLLKKYSIEEGDIIDKSISSLLYFEGNGKVIDDYFSKNFVHDDGEGNQNNKDLNSIGSLVDATVSKNRKSIQVSSNSGSGNWIYSGLSDTGKRKKGKSAEVLVYNTLVKKYGINNVRWVSGNSITPDKNDRLHYDIEYKNETGEWKCLEVKALTDNQFIISAAEKEYGINEPDKFEMALVKEDIIFMIKNIFKFEPGETFENNTKFVAQAKDYIFIFELNSLNL